MDRVILIFLACGFLFFWGVWIFGYWLPMARESQRQFKEEQKREQAAARQPPSSAPPLRDSDARPDA